MLASQQWRATSEQNWPLRSGRPGTHDEALKHSSPADHLDFVVIDLGLMNHAPLGRLRKDSVYGSKRPAPVCMEASQRRSGLPQTRMNSDASQTCNSPLAGDRGIIYRLQAQPVVRFIFPQVSGLGFSAVAQRFAIGSKEKLQIAVFSSAVLAQCAIDGGSIGGRNFFRSALGRVDMDLLMSIDAAIEPCAARKPQGIRGRAGRARKTVTSVSNRLEMVRFRSLEYSSSLRRPRFVSWIASRTRGANPRDIVAPEIGERPDNLAHTVLPAVTFRPLPACECAG
jgi:hypothetical protein